MLPSFALHSHCFPKIYIIDTVKCPMVCGAACTHSWADARAGTGLFFPGPQTVQKHHHHALVIPQSMKKVKARLKTNAQRGK